jgi:formiminotetrahydrofolate cyclodeaminase
MTTDPGGSTTTTSHPADAAAVPLDAMTVRDLVAQLASSDPTPGGGSASALGGTLAAALVAMVGRLTEGRTTSDDAATLVRETLAAAIARQSELLDLVTRDAAAYAAVVRARRLPRTSEAERSARAAELATANRVATDVPLRTARAGMSVLEMAEPLVAVGNPNAISDLGVAAHLAAACVKGGVMNVRINLPSLAAEDPMRDALAHELDDLDARAADAERRIAAAVIRRMAEPRPGAKPTPT